MKHLTTVSAALMLPHTTLRAAFILCALMTFHAQAQPEPTDATLAALRTLQIPHGQILSVERQDFPTLTTPDNQTIDNLPPRIVVELVLQPAERSRINVEVWLPEPGKWNERFLGLGNGGSAGAIDPRGLASRLKAHFAVATTDMGTAPNSDSGLGNEEVWKDFGYRATHLMTAAAKQIVTAYYGKAPKFSYFNGGSTGGQQALQEAQRYPDDYDGIVSMIPAHCRTPLHAYFLWNDQILRQCQFTPEQEALIVAAGQEYRAQKEIPAIAGKFVSDPRVTADDITAVIQLVRQKDPTLTDAQADGLRKLLDGPRHAQTGERIFNGIPLGSSLQEAHGHLYLFQWVFGRDKDLQQINFAQDIDTYTAALAPYLNAENSDLAPFAQRGGKLLMMSGTADSIVPYHATLDYYERVIAASGGLEPTRAFFRFYLVPGMGHGVGSGPGINNLPDALDLVMKWREQGLAPDELIGKRVVDGQTELEIPLYPYPTKTAWSAETQSYQPVEGPRGGVDPIAGRFRPPARE